MSAIARPGAVPQEQTLPADNAESPLRQGSRWWVHGVLLGMPFAVRTPQLSCPLSSARMTGKGASPCQCLR